MSALQPPASPAENNSNNQLEKRKRGGRQPGALNFSQEDRDALLDMVEAIRPQSKAAWDKVTDRYNDYAGRNGRKTRDTDSLTAQWRKMLTHSKPVQDQDCPPSIKRAKQLYHDISSKGGVGALDGMKDGVEGDEMDIVKEGEGEGGDGENSSGKCDSANDERQAEEEEEEEEGRSGAVFPLGSERRQSRFSQTPRITGGSSAAGFATLTPSTTSTPTRISPSPSLQSSQVPMATPPSDSAEPSSSSSSSSSTLVRTVAMNSKTTTNSSSARGSTTTAGSTSTAVPYTPVSGKAAAATRGTTPASRGAIATSAAASTPSLSNNVTTSTAPSRLKLYSPTSEAIADNASLMSDPEIQAAVEENRSMQNMIQLLQLVQTRQDLKLKEDKIERLEDRIRELERENSQLRTDKQILEMKMFMYQMQHGGEKKRKLDD